MAQKVMVQLVDDLDGSAASETVLFGLDGTTYEIDLNEKNAAKLRDAVSEYAAKGRRAGSARRHRTRPQRSYDLPALRAWAAENNIALPARGRIPRAIVEQYQAERENN